MSICVMFMVGCSGNSTDKLKSEMIGTWSISKVMIDGEWVSNPKMKAGLTFYEDGTYYGSGSFGNGEGTYEIKDNCIITYVDGDEYIRFDIKKVDETSASLIMKTDSYEYAIVAEKKK